MWLVTAVFGGASPSQTCHRATITSVGQKGYLEYEFENERLSLHAAAGAPLLNDDGQVVGVHVSETSEGEAVATKGEEAADPTGPVTGRGIASGLYFLVFPVLRHERVLSG